MKRELCIYMKRGPCIYTGFAGGGQDKQAAPGTYLYIQRDLYVYMKRYEYECVYTRTYIHIFMCI